MLRRKSFVTSHNLQLKNSDLGFSLFKSLESLLLSFTVAQIHNSISDHAVRDFSGPARMIIPAALPIYASKCSSTYGFCKCSKMASKPLMHLTRF